MGFWLYRRLYLLSRGERVCQTASAGAVPGCIWSCQGWKLCTRDKAREHLTRPLCYPQHAQGGQWLHHSAFSSSTMATSSRTPTPMLWSRSFAQELIRSNSIQVALEADHQDAHSILDRVEGIWGACNLRDLRLLKAFYDGDGFTMEAVLQRGTVDIRKILPTGLSLLDLARITPSKVSTAILEFDQKDPMPELPQQVCALCKTPREKHEQFREHPLDVCSTCVQKLRLERRASDFPENRQSILAWEDQAMAKSKPKPGGLPRKANDMANEFWVEGAIQVLVRQTSNDVEIAQLAHPFMHVAGCGWIVPV